MAEQRGGVLTLALATQLFSLDLPKTMDGAIHVVQVCTKTFHLRAAAYIVLWAITWINLLLRFVTHAPKDSTTMLVDEVPVLLVLLAVSVIQYRQQHSSQLDRCNAKAATLENTHLLQTPPPALNAHQAQTTKILTV